MGNKTLSILAKAKAHLDEKLNDFKSRNDEPVWPPHHLLCNCNKCLNRELKYIKAIHVKDPRVEAKQKAKAARKRKAAAKK